MKVTICKPICFSVLFILVFLFTNHTAVSQATVTSDQPDYPPLSTATFTGAGFLPGETVVLKVKNLTQPCNTTQGDSSYTPWTVVADADGGFVTTWIVCNCPGDSLRLKAKGQTSELVAYAYFTDAATQYSSLLITGLSSEGPFCPGSQFIVYFQDLDPSHTYLAGNIFTVELSNPGGNFPSNPIQIGSISLSGTVVSGQITATIPILSGTGSQRSIRITSSNPAAEGPKRATDIFINQAPTAYNVTGTSSFCPGGSANVGLSNTETATNYELYFNGNPTGNIVAGTGSAISFGPQSTFGVYTVVGKYTTSPFCSNTMNGSAILSSSPAPIAKTLTPTPAAGLVCTGEDVSAIATGGSGGSGIITDILEYRRNIGNTMGSWLTYISGTPISTSGYTSVDIRSYRTATGSGCQQSVINTVSWTIKSNSTIEGATATAATPSLCSGENTDISITGGSLGDGASWKWYSGSCGGTSVGTGATINVSPTSTTTYYVRAEGDCNTTDCVSVTVTVKTPSVAPTLAETDANNFCADAGGTFNLTASGGTLGTGAVVKWYSGSCGGAFVGTGNPLNISKPASTTTYYVRYEGDCNMTDCASVTVTVKTPSVVPTLAETDANNFCADAGGTFNLTASGGTLGTGAVVKWYSGSCGGAFVGTGNPLNISKPASTTTYYVRYEGDCNTTDCASVTVTVKTLSVAPTSASSSETTVCADAGGTLNLSASGGSPGTGAQLKWYSGSCGGILVGTGNPLTINKPTTTTTYFARYEGDCNTTGCTSVTVTVNTVTGGVIAKGSTQLGPGCGSLNPGQTVNTTAATGTGTLVYTWEQSTDNGTTWVPAVGEGSPPIGTFNPVNFTASTTTVTLLLRRVATFTLNSVPCSATSNILTYVVNPNPDVANILPGGTINVCVDKTVQLTNATEGGVWGTTTPALASVNSTGLVTGLSAGAANITYTVTNEFGCSTVRNRTVNVKALPACSITGTAGPVCPGSSNNYSAPASMTTYAWTLENANGASFSTATNIQNITVKAGTGCNTSYKLKLVVTNSDGCSSTCEQEVTVRDVTAPAIGDAGADATIECTATPSFTAPTASDACGTSTVRLLSDVTAAGSCANNYTRTQTWDAIDACGNTSATRTQTITVRDTQAPTIGDAGADATIECTASPSFIAPTASDACGTSTVRLLSDVTAAGSCANNYTRTQTWDAIDACGNTSVTRTQTITVRDTQAPAIGDAGADATIECTATPSFTAPTASDACGTSTVRLLSDVTAAGSCANNYTRTQTWDAIDACGNTSATRTQTITVRDTQAPTIGDAGADATIECTASPSFIAPTASDACGTSTVRLLSDVTAAGTCANNFTRTRTWDAIDACGNTSATRTQTITVRDTQAPTIGDAGADATIECTATPSFTAPTASDACGTSTVRLLSDVTAAGSCANNYTRTQTWDAIDACGNTSATRTQTITVRDTQAPTIGDAGADATIECTASPSFIAPTASDACGTSTVRLLSDVTAAGTCANNFTRTRTWDAIDACGNTSATRTQTITVRDTQAPTIGDAGADATIECTASPSFIAPTASDACGTSTVRLLSDVSAAGTCANNFTRTRTWDAIDACGNTSATRTQTITVRDTQAPTIGDAGADATIECTATPSFTAPTASDACGTSTVRLLSDVTAAGSCANNYTRTRTWDAIDACGNTSVTRTQTITVRDTQAPAIGDAGADATIECTASPSFTAPTASDACGTSTVRLLSDVTAAGSCANNYTRTRTWDAIDACGNTSATRTQTITVRDTQAPAIGDAGADATIECTASPSFTAPTASDACGTSTVRLLSDVTAAGTCANNFTRTRTWDAIDACGNTSATRTQTITVRDTQAPTIGDAGADATIECTASPSFTAPTASDACGTSTVRLLSDVTAAGSCANNYTRTRTWDAIDACGNTSVTRTQTITVRDTQAPAIGDAGADATIECTASPSFTAPTASDACGTSTVRLLSDVTAAGTCANNFTRTRTWDAIDACGNTSATRTQTITVRDTQAPTIGDAGADATIECTASPSFTAPTASDACGTSTVRLLSDVTAAGTCANNFTRTRTWDAIDACGNTSATRTQTITVRDTQAPAIGDAGADATIECTATPSFTAPTASDACGGATVNCISTVTTPGNCAGNYTITKTWNATDACGNISGTRAQTITVRDTQAPLIGWAGANATIECTASPSFTAPTASDACSGATVRLLSDVTAAGSCANNYTRTQIWDAIDACGNTSATRTQTITVRDTQAPVFTSSIVCNSTFNVNYDPSICGATVEYTVTANDNCSGVVTPTRTNGLESGSVFPLGTTVVTHTATDACGNTSSCTFTIKVNPAPTTSTLTVTPGTQQYSDTVRLCAKITNGASSCGSNAAASVTFKIGTQVMGTVAMVADGTDLVGVLTTPLVETPSNPSNGQLAPGNRTVSAVFNGVNAAYSVSNPSNVTVTITKEDARIDYTGDQFIATPCGTCVTQTVTLRALIKDITEVDPGADNYPGDIRNAKVKFVNRDNNTDISGWIPVTALVNPANLKVGTVTFPMVVTLGSSEDYRLITVGVVVGNDGYYLRDNADDNTVVTVYKPVGDFITGGGYIIPTNSVGTKASDPGRKTNFGFNVKFNKTGKSLQGNLNIIFRRTEPDNIIHIYQVKANAMQSLGVNASNPNRQTAEYVSKTNLTDITNPLSPISLGGNKYLYVKMTDNGEPGTADSISFVLVDGTADPTILGNIIYSSNWVANKTQQMRLSGGNLVVHSGFNLSSSNPGTIQADLIVDQAPQPVADMLEVKAIPNPAEHSFTLVINSKTNEMIVIKVFDLAGRQVKMLKARVGETIRFGDELKTGTYFAEVVQGEKRKTVKLIKQ